MASFPAAWRGVPESIVLLDEPPGGKLRYTSHRRSDDKIAVYDFEDSEKVYQAIDAVFHMIGIQSVWLKGNQWVRPGEFELFIPIKNQ